MTSPNKSFATHISALQYRYDLSQVFDDFLTLTICSFSRNPVTGLSYLEDEYLATISRYDKESADLFPKLLGSLIIDMELRVKDSQGNDVLGEFYEEHLANKKLSQVFTPFELCETMARLQHLDDDEPKYVLDPCCGSGRMQLAFAKVHGKHHRFFAIDVDPRCAKMTAINFFLNGMFRAEVMCANALDLDNFRMSYRTSFLPLGVFRVNEKERSELWNLHRGAFAQAMSERPDSQLHMF